MGEEKRKPRKTPFPGIEATLVGRSIVETLQQSPSRKGETAVAFKEKECAKSLD